VNGTRASRIVWHEDADESAWIAHAAVAIAEALRESLAESGRVRLLLSGGSTPEPVHRALAEETLDWSRVVVGLVDDRDVDPDDAGSNARLVRETFLIGRAAAAHFDELRPRAQSPDAAVAQANARWREQTSIPIAAVVLGMGDDGHTASLFPGTADLERALASREPYVAFDAKGCVGAGIYPRRITLTPLGLAESKQRFLLLRGGNKRDIFRRALEGGDVRELPIRTAIDLSGAPLQVYWCP